MILQEENIDTYIKESQLAGHSLNQTFDNIRKDAIGLEDYSSLYNNYIAIFIYELMRQKTPIDDFAQVMQHIFKVSKLEELQGTFRRFLYIDDADINLQEYVGYNRFENDLGWWENMHYFFLDIENDKLTLCSETSPYLLEMLKHFNKKNIGALHEAHFSWFCANFFNNPECLAPILQTIDNNPAYKHSDGNNYFSFYRGLLSHELGHKIYNMNEQQRKDIISVLTNNISNFDIIFKEVLLPKEDDNFKVELSMLKVINEIGVEKMIGWLQTALNKNVNKHDNDTYDKYSAYHSFGSTLQIALENTFISQHNSCIDFTKSIGENFIALKILQIQAQQQHHFDVPGLKEYIEQQTAIEKDSKEKYEHISNLLDCKKIITYMNYVELGDALPMNTTKVKRPKV